MDVGIHMLDAERLQHFGGVAMSGRREAAHGSRTLRMMRRVARCGTALTAADFYFTDDAAAEVHQSGRGQRQDRESGGGGVAANAADVLGSFDLGSVQLWQTVNKLFEPDGICMRRAIPAGVIVGAPQSEIGAEINDTVCQLGKAIDAVHG